MMTGVNVVSLHSSSSTSDNRADCCAPSRALGRFQVLLRLRTEPNRLSS